MTSPSGTDFPELRRVFEGYLHEDFLEEYESPAAAVRAFLADANDAERRRFAADVRRFLADIDDMEFVDVRARLARLGCRWRPPSRKALAAALMVNETRDSE